MNDWIKVEDRLPELSVTVLAVFIDKGIPYDIGLVILARYYDKQDTWFWDGGCIEDEGRISHWMPLPDPPKDNEGE